MRNSLTIHRTRDISFAETVVYRETFPALILPLLARLPWSLTRKTIARTEGILHLYDLQEQRNLYVSGCLSDALGYSEAELRAMGTLAFALLLHPDDRAPLAEYYLRFPFLELGETIDIAYRLRRANGEWCWLHSRETPYRYPNDFSAPKLIGIVEEFRPEERTNPSDLFPGAGDIHRIEIVLPETNETFSIGPFADPATAGAIYRQYFAAWEKERVEIPIEINITRCSDENAPERAIA